MSLFSNQTSSTTPMRLATMWSNFGGQMVGVILDGCETSLREAEEMGHVALLDALPEPAEPGVWYWEGTLHVFRTFEGDYDADYQGAWRR